MNEYFVTFSSDLYKVGKGDTVLLTWTSTGITNGTVSIIDMDNNIIGSGLNANGSLSTKIENAVQLRLISTDTVHIMQLGISVWEVLVQYKSSEISTQTNSNLNSVVNEATVSQTSIYITLEDIDKAIVYYITTIIKPTIEDNGNHIPVPVIYGSPERWKSVQKDGYYRDKNSKIMLPLIMVKRTDIKKNRDVTRNLDANNPNIFMAVDSGYTSRNRYDRFSVLNNIKPQKRIMNVVVPDYVQITYEGLIWSNYITQMNRIIESIEYAESSYWGIPDRYRFYTVINDFSNTLELQEGEDRMVKTTFSLEVSAHLIPEVIQRDVRNVNEFEYTANQIVIE